MADETNHGEKPFCWYSLQCFSSLRILECHIKSILAINHTKSVLLPEENQYINFQNFKRLAKALFQMYGDVECVLIPLTDNIDFGPNTKKYQDHIVCSYGYKLIYVDERYLKPFKTYIGEDAIDKFLNDMIKKVCCSKVIETI